jgi:hypothetical protein
VLLFLLVCVFLVDLLLKCVHVVFTTILGLYAVLSTISASECMLRTFSFPWPMASPTSFLGMQITKSISHVVKITIMAVHLCSCSLQPRCLRHSGTVRLGDLSGSYPLQSPEILRGYVSVNFEKAIFCKNA